ncbi:hypothetical protein BDZ94DRAFT_1225554 [Collybia nuda]|uniref:F-box domain-containing protein n=1 Tax=Collybia nuda TaxID=64659 RepID=A0A9P6CB08_9AGAR|nr:hypothetical protein BDZ94DRAFT_1225554 [Collybia nuda]
MPSAFTATPTPSSWNTLPNEMKLAVVDNLHPADIKAFSKVDQRTYEICVPATFRTIKISSQGNLQRFLDNVPRSYCRHIQELDLCTDIMPGEAVSYQNLRERTEPVIALLLAAPRLVRLALRMAGSLDKSLITPFAYFSELRQLTITNCSPEEHAPLSERLVVSMAANVQNLEHLSLDRISRSRMHAPELDGVYPYIPLVFGDEDIPAHPTLGPELSLPALLRLPTLRKLTIRDTHLGDARWATTPVACRLEVLDVGSCYHENEDFNRACTERIMAAVGETVDEFSLTTSVSDSVFAAPGVTPLQRLRKLHITPFFPVESVVDTMSNLAGSPIESLSMQCYEDDVVDVCSALEDFLSLRVERGPEFYDKLTRIDVSVAASGDGEVGGECDREEMEERVEATKRLQELCRDLRLASVVGKAGPVCAPLGAYRAPAAEVKAPAHGRVNLLA